MLVSSSVTSLGCIVIDKRVELSVKWAPKEKPLSKVLFQMRKRLYLLLPRRARNLADRSLLNTANPGT